MICYAPVIMKSGIIIMRTSLLALLLAVPFIALAETDPKKSEKQPSDSEIKEILIRQSIAGYSGNCPCPYSTDRAGRRCGGRSAWSRPGGASPLCYEGDVTQSRVDSFRKKSSKLTPTPSKAPEPKHSVARPPSSSSGKVYVRGYYRKDGTYVRPHYRSKPRKR